MLQRPRPPSSRTSSSSSSKAGSSRPRNSQTQRNQQNQQHQPQQHADISVLGSLSVNNTGAAGAASLWLNFKGEDNNNSNSNDCNNDHNDDFNQLHDRLQQRQRQRQQATRKLVAPSSSSSSLAVSEIHSALRDSLSIARRGLFTEALAMCRVVWERRPPPAEDEHQNMNVELQAALYGLTLNMSTFCCCGSVVASSSSCSSIVSSPSSRSSLSFDQARLYIVDAYKLSASTSDIENAEYNLRVIDTLAASGPVEESTTAAATAAALVEAFFTVSPQEEAEGGQDEEDEAAKDEVRDDEAAAEDQMPAQIQQQHQQQQEQPAEENNNNLELSPELAGPPPSAASSPVQQRRTAPSTTSTTCSTSSTVGASSPSQQQHKIPQPPERHSRTQLLTTTPPRGQQQQTETRNNHSFQKIPFVTCLPPSTRNNDNSNNNNNNNNNSVRSAHLIPLRALTLQSPEQCCELVGCCQQCVLRALLLGLLSMQRLGVVFPRSVPLSADSVLVVKQSPLAALMQKQRLLSGAGAAVESVAGGGAAASDGSVAREDKSGNSSLSSPCCESSPFYDVIRFPAIVGFAFQKEISAASSSSSSSLPPGSPSQHHQQQQQLIEQRLVIDAKAFSLLACSVLNHPSFAAARDKLVSGVQRAIEQRLSPPLSDYELLKLPAPRPPQQNLSQNHQQQNIHSDSKKKISKQQKQQRRRENARLVSFRDAFELFVEPAMATALRLHGTLHMRLQRAFLHSGVLLFFDTLLSTAHVIASDHHSNDHLSEEEDDDGSDERSDQDGEVDGGGDSVGDEHNNGNNNNANRESVTRHHHRHHRPPSSFAAASPFLRPLTVVFDGESGVDAGVGGLTNDMLQRFVEHFEGAWAADVASGALAEAGMRPERRLREDLIEPQSNRSQSGGAAAAAASGAAGRVGDLLAPPPPPPADSAANSTATANANGDPLCRANCFGAVMAKACLERRRVVMRYAPVLCRAAACGSDPAGWLLLGEEGGDENEQEEEEEEEEWKDFAKFALECFSTSSSQNSNDDINDNTVIEAGGGAASSAAPPPSSSSSSPPQKSTATTFQLEMSPPVAGEDGWTITVGSASPIRFEDDEFIENQNNNNNNNKSSKDNIRSNNNGRSNDADKKDDTSAKLRTLLLHQLSRHAKVLDEIREGFVTVIHSALPFALRRHLLVRGCVSFFKRSAASSSSPSPSAFSSTGELNNHRNNKIYSATMKTSDLISYLCCSSSLGSSSSSSLARSGASSLLAELTGRQVVECLEFRNWGYNHSNQNEQSSNQQNNSNSTPYFLCCWLHYRATPDLRRKFLRFCTCVPHPPTDGQRVVVQRDDERLMARTCLCTLHLPTFESLAALTESIEMALHVMELDGTMSD